MKLINDIIKYIKYRKEISQIYNYGLRKGYFTGEDYSWRERLDYWERSVSFDPDEYEE